MSFYPFSAAGQLLSAGGRLLGLDPARVLQAWPVPAGPQDNDADAFWLAAALDDNATYYPGTPYQISGSDMHAALTDLVIALKAGGAWAKLRAIYPVIGGSSFAHQWNLRNVATFPTSFAGSPAHGPQGIGFNGSTQHADTGFVFGTELTAAQGTTMAVYSQTPGATPPGSDLVDIGAFQSNDQGYILSVQYQLTGTMLIRAWTSYYFAYEHANGKGLYTSTATPAGATIYEPGGLSTGDYSVGGQLPTIPVYFGACNVAGQGAYGHTPRTFSFVALGAALTPGEAAAFHAAVEQFHAALHRA
jgi:hypothetical protein